MNPRWLVTLALVWLALWSGLGVPAVLGALVVSATVLALVGPDTAPGRRPRPRPAAMLRLVGRFAVDLVVASIAVTVETLTPAARGRPGIIAVPLRSSSSTVTTVVANLVSLTPGSVTVDVRPGPLLFVHLLQLDDADEVREAVRHLEDLVVAALGHDRDGAGAGADEEVRT